MEIRLQHELEMVKKISSWIFVQEFIYLFF